jgi:hypothetical protein
MLNLDDPNHHNDPPIVNSSTDYKKQFDLLSRKHNETLVELNNVKKLQKLNSSSYESVKKPKYDINISGYHFLIDTKIESSLLVSIIQNMESKYGMKCVQANISAPISIIINIDYCISIINLCMINTEESRNAFEQSIELQRSKYLHIHIVMIDDSASIVATSSLTKEFTEENNLASTDTIAVNTKEELFDHINAYMKNLHQGESNDRLKDIISLSEFNTQFFAQQKFQIQCSELVTKYPTLNYLTAAKILLLTDNISNLNYCKDDASFDEFYTTLMNNCQNKYSNLKHRLQQFIKNIPT